jgi:hypothetical protein
MTLLASSKEIFRERNAARLRYALKSYHLAGATIWNPKADGGRHEVATTVQKDRFFEHYFGFFK